MTVTKLLGLTIITIFFASCASISPAQVKGSGPPVAAKRKWIK